VPKLTDTQLILLATAAEHDDKSLLPFPKKLKLEPDTAERIFQGLIKKKLVAEQPAGGAAAAWRQTTDGRRLTLVITQAGLRAIGVEPDKPEAGEGAPNPQVAKARSRKPRPSTGGRSPESKPSGDRAAARSAATSSARLAGPFGPRRHVGSAEEEAGSRYRQREDAIWPAAVSNRGNPLI
jgi:hypothetical protein